MMRKSFNNQQTQRRGSVGNTNSILMGAVARRETAGEDWIDGLGEDPTSTDAAGAGAETSKSPEPSATSSKRAGRASLLAGGGAESLASKTLPAPDEMGSVSPKGPVRATRLSKKESAEDSPRPRRSGSVESEGEAKSSGAKPQQKQEPRRLQDEPLVSPSSGDTLSAGI